MGLGIAKKVQDAFMLSEVPGAIQIRLSGVKGMLSIKRDFPPDKIGSKFNQTNLLRALITPNSLIANLLRSPTIHGQVSVESYDA